MSNSQEQKFIMMTETPVKPLICRLAVPTIISMLVTSFYNMADTYFVGKIDTSASAAVGVAFSLMAIIQAVGFFFGHGSGNFISRSLGRHDMESAEKMASIGFFSSVIIGGLITAVGLTFLEPIARMLGSTDTILPYAKQYMGLILIGAPWMTSSLVLNNQLRLQGDAVYAMIGLVSGAVLNIALDPLFIFAFKMGISGAAAATILSQFVSFALLWIGIYRSDAIKIRLKNFRPSLKQYLAIANGGMPSLLRQGLNSIATTCLNVAAGTAAAAGIIDPILAAESADAAIAGMSIVTRIMMFANSCLIGFGQGFQPVCGFNYGAKKYSRVKEGFWFCVKVATVVLLVLAIIGYAFAPQIVQAFRDGDAQVAAVGSVAMRMQCISFPLAAWVVMCNFLAQNIGKGLRASFLATSRQGLFFIPAVLILPQFLGLFGVQIAQMTADIISFAFSIPLQISLLREMNREIEAGTAS